MFQCDFCNKLFAKKSNLIKHRRIHTGEKPYQCEVCEKAFSQRTSLVIHMRRHTGERPFQCEICNKEFVQKSDLNRHKNICKYSGIQILQDQAPEIHDSHLCPPHLNLKS